jgi:hypothetical protein
MPPTRRRAGIIPDTEWEMHKDTIKRLYLDEHKELPVVRGLMSSQYGFVAR